MYFVKVKTVKLSKMQKKIQRYFTAFQKNYTDCHCKIKFKKIWIDSESTMDSN